MTGCAVSGDDLGKPPDSRLSGVLRVRVRLLGIWRNRFCYLTSHALHIARSVSSTSHSRVLVIDGCTDIKFRPAKCQISIRPRSSAKFLFSASRPVLQRWLLLLRITAASRPVSLDLFRVVVVLGRAAHGKVTLVERMDTGEVFVLKTVHKRRLLSVDADRALLATLRGCPFVANLAFAFESDRKFFLALEYPIGGQLLDRVQSIPSVTIDDVRLYIAEMVIAIDHVHASGFVCPGLRPETVLLTRDGHAVFADFGLGFDIATESGMADDWAALGALCSELLGGESAFWGDELAVDLVARLVVRDGQIGSMAIRSHPFFAAVDWGRLLRLEIHPRALADATSDSDVLTKRLR